MLSYLIPAYVLYIINFFKYKVAYSGRIISAKAFIKNSKLGERVMILGGVMLENCEVGDYSFIAGHEVGGLSSHIKNTKIGKYCSIAENLKVLTNSHNLKLVTTYPFYSAHNSFLLRKDKKNIDFIEKHVVIGNDVWIGANVTIMGGVTIGDGAVVGAGSIVTKDVEPYAIVVSVPAKVVRYRFNKATIKKLTKIKWWNWPEKKIEKHKNLIMSDKTGDFVKKATAQHLSRHISS